MKVHFIAIGGSVMHNLALSMHFKGDQVSGSDDEIFEPARSRLQQQGLLPEKQGWFPEKITPDLDAVILGMHAKADNPELLKARELGLKINSFPEFLYEHSKHKKRIVIGGSHGKTTITAMIMHVLKDRGLDFDYMVGAQLKGFEVMVRISEEAQVMIFEGDEYLTSALDKRPKFHLYKPHIAVISGIEWDHMNVFPTKTNYIEQFEKFCELIEDQGVLIYCLEDELVKKVADAAPLNLEKIPYGIPKHLTKAGRTYVINDGEKIEFAVFGKHNLMNLNAARTLCNQLGIKNADFYRSIKTYRGAAKRLELLAENKSVSVFKDFAHAPSKLRATIEAVKSRNPERDLVAVMELHTYSSLNRDFLPEYKNTMDLADEAVVFYNPHACEIKRLPFINKDDVRSGFNRSDLKIMTKKTALENFLLKKNWESKNLLMMSSGDFGGLDIAGLSVEISRV
ncbi:MAG: peptidoglycan synthetase [Bacteroidales bacterium]|nr:peptidoglycan synthetase [Bacteroidales bacterium]MCF8343743.1 peptidoglycan synthetase [Bacteroidales bacterium]MCF8349661.1 peptidoglycan synthetase [Bacteroidales bacterium]MCF8374907.1 peptidoglycan synthetase [Bacteroidales bacterium]MCF8400114.1 peptidoglycan synthetase [Bacteroidales bacterium]